MQTRHLAPLHRDKALALALLYRNEISATRATARVFLCLPMPVHNDHIHYAVGVEFQSPASRSARWGSVFVPFRVFRGHQIDIPIRVIRGPLSLSTRPGGGKFIY
jgi:hypothetical protein